MLAYLFGVGIGVWGLQNPVGWGFAIVNFVFWVGIGHAGTLISAVLFLFRQKWRTGINRAAEAMTIFAVICALIFPGIHIGRWWMPYYMIPYPNQMDMWPNFRSPLLWDVFAVGTYFTVSLLFWYMGMIPDLASLRDRATTRVRRLAYGILAAGWRGSQRHWHRYERAYLILAALATPLVLSVHSVVSFDFAVSILPGWHTTIFPPYFVAGAIFSGFAMVITLLIPARQWFGLRDFVTLRHLENMCKIILVTGSIVGYAYSVEFFIAWYSGNALEQFTFLNRALGPYMWAYWTMVFCNVVVPQAFWFKKVRTEYLDDMAPLYSCKRRHVVRAIRHRCIIVGQRFPAFQLGLLHADLGGYRNAGGKFRDFLHPVLVVLQVSADDRDRRSQGRDAAGRPALSCLRIDTGGILVGEHGENSGVDRGANHADRLPAPKSGTPAGMLGEFETPNDLIRGAEDVRKAGYKRWDAHTPFPIHGLDRAMGIKDTVLGWLVLGGGLSGCLFGVWMQWWMNAVDYPHVISGKPLWSLPCQYSGHF